jgi:glucan 1,3-beta-glucosidase
MDQYTFCEALGPEEGNRVLRDHWDTWITEEIIAEAAAKEVEMVRLPIGDWTLKPYGPYVGCTDGAKDKITWLLDTCEKYNIKVLLDVHAVRGSQNGYDNSGLANRTEWSDENNFSHWEHALGEWMGEWDNDAGHYVSINQANIDWAKDTVQGLLDTWGDHPALAAIEPVNEPWWCSDLDVLTKFYQDVRTMMKEQQPRLKFVFHDSFHFDPDFWNQMFSDDDMENVVMDTHQYFAWGGAHGDIGNYCDEYGSTIGNALRVKYDVWVGEWSLATDVCATWLGGFNDANTDASRECQRVECPVS